MKLTGTNRSIGLRSTHAYGQAQMTFVSIGYNLANPQILFIRKIFASVFKFAIKIVPEYMALASVLMTWWL